MIHDPRRPDIAECSRCGVLCEDPRGRNAKRIWLCTNCVDAGEARRRAAYLPDGLRATVKALARIGNADEAERVLRRCTDDEAQLAVALEVFNDHRNLYREGRSR